MRRYEQQIPPAKIILPGLDEQLNYFVKNYSLEGTKGLLMGPGLHHASITLRELGADTETIINDDALLIEERLNIKSSVKFMDYYTTDFLENSFDFIYAQASVSTVHHTKILKELFRILKQGGMLCVGEIVKRDFPTPRSVKDIWNLSNITPFLLAELPPLYASIGYEIFQTIDLTDTMEDLYKMQATVLKSEKERLSDDDRYLMRRNIKSLQHEANMYLRGGAQKHTLYHLFLLKKPL